MDKTIIHNPVFRVSGSDTEPSSYSLTDHNHDGVYAATGHNHDGVYSPVGHTHDFSGDFAAIDHNHDGTYSPTGHNHDGVYSVVGHTHDYSLIFAAIDHNHDSTYAPKSHSDITDGNPHGVTAAHVGKDTAQWNAAKLQGKTLSSTAPTDGQVQTWNETAQEWQPANPPGATGGEANTASNLGSGTGLFSSKSGVDLQFNSIAAGDGLSISVASNTITLASSIKNKFNATAAPTATDDTTEGYAIGSRWIDVTNDKVYNCVDATDGAAIWNEVGAGDSGGGGLTVVEVTGTSQTVEDGKLYIANNASNIDFDLPATMALGFHFGIIVKGAGGYTIKSGANGQAIKGVGFSSVTATAADQGLSARTTTFDYQEFVCTTSDTILTKINTDYGETNTSYSNPLGSGNRSSLITTTDSGFTWGAGNVAMLVNGVESGENIWFNGSDCTGWWMDFEMSDDVLVNQVQWIQTDWTSGQGTWKFQASNDGANYFDIGNSFNLGGALTQTITVLDDNTIKAKYWRLLGVSNNTSGDPITAEIKFKIGSK